MVVMQGAISILEEELASANQRLANTSLSSSDTSKALEDTQAALRQAEGQVYCTDVLYSFMQHLDLTPII